MWHDRDSILKSFQILLGSESKARIGWCLVLGPQIYFMEKKPGHDTIIEQFSCRADRNPTMKMEERSMRA